MLVADRLGMPDRPIRHLLPIRPEMKNGTVGLGARRRNFLRLAFRQIQHMPAANLNFYIVIELVPGIQTHGTARNRLCDTLLHIRQQRIRRGRLEQHTLDDCGFDRHARVMIRALHAAVLESIWCHHV